MQVEDMVSFGIGAMVEVPCSVQATVESAQLGVYLAMDGIGKQRIAVHKVKTERFGVLVVQYGVSYEEQVDDVSDFQSGYGLVSLFLLYTSNIAISVSSAFPIPLLSCQLKYILFPFCVAVPSNIGIRVPIETNARSKSILISFPLPVTALFSV